MFQFGKKPDEPSEEAGQQPTIEEIVQATHDRIFKESQDKLAALTAETQNKLDRILSDWSKAAEMLGTKGGLPGLLEIERQGGTIIYIPATRQTTNRGVNLTLSAGQIATKSLQQQEYDVGPQIPNYRLDSRTWVGYDLLIVLLPSKLEKGA